MKRASIEFAHMYFCIHLVAHIKHSMHAKTKSNVITKREISLGIRSVDIPQLQVMTNEVGVL